MNILTMRERQVLTLIVGGCTTRQIAAELCISFKTAACHRDHILSKSGAANTADLVRRAIQNAPHLSLPSEELGERVVASCRANRESRRMLRVELDQSEELWRQCRQLRSEFLECGKVLENKCAALLEASQPVLAR